MSNSILNSDGDSVQVRVEDIVIPTYLPLAPDKNPMFLEKRVYQGSSGKVYPLPFTDRISEIKTDHAWKGVTLENEYVSVMILPEIGGRIHAIQDKTNGYDAIYRQNVIKPALVGLAGPWASGGIEFNWPQHHRPATFLPVDFSIEEHEDGSKTVWCSDHDPMNRLKGMHGVCLHPAASYVELKVRVYNRTPLTQTFLWWANIATRSHEGYKSFFPPDVHYVADHAKRAMSEYPLCRGAYYGVDYAARAQDGVPESECPADFVPPSCSSEERNAKLAHVMPLYPANDLSWYANIPVPTSYMCMNSEGDFFGGYDYFQRAGLIHCASHYISPGKKQWTWGNHEFGYAWDRNLTDTDGPYVEIMAGVYTDNQPDFSFLEPGETKTWSQYLYPFQEIGPAHYANRDAAVRIDPEGHNQAKIGVCATSRLKNARITLQHAGETLGEWTADLSPGHPFKQLAGLPTPEAASDLIVRVTSGEDIEILSYHHKAHEKGQKPAPATEPDAPEKIASVDELFITGLHLEQYRHATRSPLLYWNEALRRDPGDSRCNNAVGLWRLRRGEHKTAERHFQRAIERLTLRNPNPQDCDPYYNLGLALRRRLDAEAHLLDEQTTGSIFEQSYAAFYKATWSQARASAAYHALAELDCRRADWTAAIDHIDRSLRLNIDNMRARNLKAIVLRKLGRGTEAEAVLLETIALDPMDWWARYLSRERIGADLQVALDLAFDFSVAGLYDDAVTLLHGFVASAHGLQALYDGGDLHKLPTQSWGAPPMVLYTLAWLYDRRGERELATLQFKQAAELSPDYCFPHRIEEIAVLETAMRWNSRDSRAPYYLGNMLYDLRRHEEAIDLWERSTEIDSSYSVVWRNLGIGYYNVATDSRRAWMAYDRAVQSNPQDARLIFERDQLWKRLSVSPQVRLAALEQNPDLVERRDDLTIELCALYNQVGQPERAQRMLARRRFQPWEGGEGQALGQHVRTHLALGRRALASGRAVNARHYFEAALTAPKNLSESKHLLANQSDIHYWLGTACAEIGDTDGAARHWRIAAMSKGDFQEMSIQPYSEMTYYSALSLQRLGLNAEAEDLLLGLRSYAEELEASQAKIDYFATSLPLMLLFDDDIQFRQLTTALFLEAQACAALDDRDAARALLAQVLDRDPNHPLASDLMSELNTTELRMPSVA